MAERKRRNAETSAGDPRKRRRRSGLAVERRVLPSYLSFRRIIWIVLDSVGIGAMPDAAAFGDPPGGDTLGNIARRRGLDIPNLAALGLGNIRPIPGIAPAAAPAASYGRCALASPGKDTTTGHWEMVGIHLAKPFPLYPHGFPPEIMDEFERRIGRSSLGNKAASGTEIINELGEEHMRTGSPIVYTSADSVFQIAAHEEVIPLWELYKICETARDILRGPHEVGRVIARPFLGSPGKFTRTANRHDYAVPPPKGMLLDQLDERGVKVYSVGKIFDVFLGRGIRDEVKTKSNADGMAKTLAAMGELDAGLIFVNLVDFDQQYGHRNDIEGYGAALEQFDAWLPEFQSALKEGDLAIFTADHGCDPCIPGTDHSREYVPLLASGPQAKRGVDLGLRATLSDIGQTVAANFGAKLAHGDSFLERIL
jgi:phosphopentomutase